MPVRRFVLPALLLIACRAPVPASPSLEAGFGAAGDAPAVPLDTLVATSGRGAEALVDGSDSTGWQPSADPGDEGVTFGFSSPVVADAIAVRGCDATSRLKVRVYLDGSAGPEFSVSAHETHAELLREDASRHGFGTLFLRITAAQGQACLAEVSLSRGGVRVPLVAPRAVRGQVRAVAAEDARVLFDQDPGSTWSPGDGAGALVTLDAPITLTALQLWNGDQRDGALFRASGRAATLQVSVDGGPPVSVDVADRAGAQTVRLATPLVGSAFDFRVDAATPGERSPGAVLAELRLVDATGPLVLVDVDGGTSGDDWADRDLTSVCGFPKRTLKLRSDGTFARWDPAVDDRLSGRWATAPADGTWCTFDLHGIRLGTGPRWVSADGGQRGAQAVDDTVRLGTVADLGPEVLASLLDTWGRGDRADRVSCLTEEVGGWPGAYAALVERHARVVDGAVVDLVWDR